MTGKNELLSDLRKKRAPNLGAQISQYVGINLKQLFGYRPF